MEDQRELAYLPWELAEFRRFKHTPCQPFRYPAPSSSPARFGRAPWQFGKRISEGLHIRGKLSLAFQWSRRKSSLFNKFKGLVLCHSFQYCLCHRHKCGLRTGASLSKLCQRKRSKRANSKGVRPEGCVTDGQISMKCLNISNMQ